LGGSGLSLALTGRSAIISSSISSALVAFDFTVYFACSSSFFFSYFISGSLGTFTGGASAFAGGSAALGFGASLIGMLIPFAF